MESLIEDRSDEDPLTLNENSSHSQIKEEQRFLKVSHFFDIQRSLAEATQARQSAKRRRIDVVFPINQSSGNSGKWSLFVCLPVDSEETGLPAVVNGDWLLTASREQLDMMEEAKQWNRFLVSQLPISYAKVIDLSMSFRIDVIFIEICSDYKVLLFHYRRWFNCPCLSGSLNFPNLFRCHPNLQQKLSNKSHHKLSHF